MTEKLPARDELFGFADYLLASLRLHRAPFCRTLPLHVRLSRT